MIYLSQKDADVEEIYVMGEDPEHALELVGTIKQAWDEDGYANRLPSELYMDEQDKFFGNLGDNDDYNDYSNWRGNFFGVPHVRKRVIDMMNADNISPETSNVTIQEKSEDGAHQEAGEVPISDERPGKEIADYVTKVLEDVDVPRAE